MLRVKLHNRIIFLDVKDTLENAIIYFLMLINVIDFNKKTLLKVFANITKASSLIENEKQRNLIRYALVAIIMAAIFVVDQFLVSLVRNY